jgi:hypothetical protein
MSIHRAVIGGEGRRHHRSKGDDVAHDAVAEPGGQRETDTDRRGDEKGGNDIGMPSAGGGGATGGTPGTIHQR